MVVSQQISPSALRAYKLSKYANGQPGKMLLEAKKIKRVTSQFMSKSGAKEAAKRMKALKSTAANAKKVADAAKKTSDVATKVNDALLKKVPGGAPLDKAARIGAIMGILAAIGVVALLKFQEFISGRTFDDLATTQIDLTKTNTIAVNNGLKLKTLETKLQKYEQELSANARDYYRLNKQQESFGKSILDVKKQSNDALYETRQGRTILESKITQSQKQSNDALYETRQTKFNLEAKIQQINANIARISSSANDGFQNAVNTTISKLQAELASVRANLKTIKPATPVDTASITANAVSAAKTEARIAQSQISALQAVVAGLGGQLAAALTLGNTAISGISNLGNAVNTANNTANTALQEARSKANSGITPMQQSNLSKEFDKKLADFERLSTMTADERFEEFKKENNKALGIRDLQQSSLSKEFDKRQADFERLSTMTADQRFQEFQRTNRESLGLLEKDLSQTKKEIDASKATITKIDTKLGQQIKVNEEALPKLDQILGILPLIPARAAAAIRPNIPTMSQLETAAATGTCRTTQPGGCMSKALADNAANITNNNNANAANILDAVNTGANAALLAGQNTILERLGPQLPGGLSSTFGRLWKTLQVDRILNVLILITTFHNALMLSNNIAETLFGAVDNISQAVGFKWKNEKGEEEGFGEIVKEWTSDFFKSIFGVANYNNLVAAYKRANRIYQAGANIINATRSMVDSLRNITEYCAESIGKVGNALKKAGTIASDAFNWMPENVDGRSIWIRRLENINEVAEGLEMVTGEVLGITQNINEIREQTDEFNRGIKDLPPKDRDNNQPVKAREDTSTAASTSVIIPESSERKPTS